MHAAAALHLAALALTGCAGAPSVSDLMQVREADAHAAQERRFEGAGAAEVQLAVVTVLQDLGFQLAASEPSLGLIVATRGEQSTAGDYAARFGSYMRQGLKNALTFQWHVRPEPERFVGPVGLSAVVAISPVAAGAAVRLSLHRFVRRPTGEPIIVWAEQIAEPEPHRQFFALLARALSAERRG